MTLTKRQLVAITLWWAEGSKSRRDKRWKSAVSYPIEITNTDPAIIRIFLDFIRIDIGVPEEKIKLQLQIHDGDIQSNLEDYWSKVTDIEQTRFNKTIVRPIGNKKGKSKGTCKVRFSDKATYKKLHEMLQIALKDIYNSPQSVLQLSESSITTPDLLK